MKKNVILSVIVAAVMILSGCLSSAMQTAMGYSDEELTELRKTPEPGVVMNKEVAMLLDGVRVVLEVAPDESSMANSASAAEPKALGKESMTQFALPVDDGSEIELYLCDPRRKKDTATIPVILFIHGGGFIGGDYAGYSRFIRKLAVETHAIVVAPMYRLAPAHPYPAAVNDSFAAYQWVLEHATDYGADTSQIFVAGDSAGGNLSAAVTLKVYDEGLPLPNGIMLYYPVLDMRDVPYLSREYYDGRLGGFYILDRPNSEYMREVYVGQANDTERYLSPLLADIPADFPAVLQIAAEVDPLRDDALYMDIALKRVGVPVDTYVFESMPHGFMSLDRVLKDANKAFALSRDFVKTWK